MAKSKNSGDMILGSHFLQPLGEKANIPLAHKITAQVLLSREQSDIVLAQKATDLVLKEAKNDLPKYLPKVLVNEMEILSDHLKKVSSENKLYGDLEDRLSEMTERLHKLLVKYFPQGIDVVGEDSGIGRGVFEIHIRNFIEKYFFFSIRREYSTFEKLFNEINFILPLRNMVRGKEELRNIDTLIWQHHLDRFVAGMIEDVIYPDFANQIDYNSLVEPENDPEYICYKYGKQILFSFICNPIYEYEDINRKARQDLWLCDVFDKEVSSVESMGKDEEEVFDNAGQLKLKSLLFDFLKGSIKRELLSTRITAIKKEMRKHKKE